MIYTRLWNYFFQASEQPHVALFVFLSGRSCDPPRRTRRNRAAASIDSQIIVRISRIPKDAFRNCPLGLGR
jgi:hypothetical protein